MFVLTLLAAVQAGQVAVGAKGDDSPVDRVITLLKDLQSQVQQEGSQEAAVYDAFACFCKNKDEAKTSSIDTRESESTRLSASLKELTATRAQLMAEIQQAESDLAMHEASLAKATDLRNKERAVYEETHLDCSNAVSGLADAISAIQGSKAGLTQMKTQVNKVLLLADAASMQSARTAQVTGLLQQIPEVPENDYDFHSGGILKLLEELKTEWDQKKTKLENEEQASADAFNAAAEAKRGEIQAAKDLIDTDNTRLAETNSDISDDDKDLTEETALLADDQTYLKDLTEQCERKAREWDQRSSMRKDELAALGKALEIIEGTVLDNEGGGADRYTKKRPAASALTQQEVDTGSDDYSDVVFVQTRESREVRKQTQVDPRRNKVITLLKLKGQKLSSSALSVLAMQLAADPFAKVKTLVQKLIERLVREKTDEATHKGWCDTEIAKANHDRDYRHGDVESLSANIKVLEARKAKLTQTAADLRTSINDLNDAYTEATNLRTDDKAANKATLESASEGYEALKNAIQVLEDFYRKAARAKTSLLETSAEASPVNQDMAGEGTGGFAGSYKGNQAKAGGIMGMLETIKSDFERTIKETTSSEEQAHRDYVKFERETKASIRSQERGLEQTENDLQTTSSDLVNDLNNLKENQSLLDGSLRTLETLRPACVDTGMTWDEKVARREAEIEALKDALCVLDEEDGEYASECGRLLFLQRK